MKPPLPIRRSLAGPALLAFATALGVAPGCAANPTEIKTARPGQAFTLRVGESASVQGASLVIQFLEVAGDSRCPKGAQCVWEGDATVRISVRRGTGPAEKQDLHTSSREPAAQAGAVHLVRLMRLEPQPVIDRAIQQAEYEATLEIDPA